jgi:hypothetical protein
MIDTKRLRLDGEDVREGIAELAPEPRHLLPVPKEIRVMIYEYVFQGSSIAYDPLWLEDKMIAEFNEANTSDHRNLLLASKSCYLDALTTYYRESSTVSLMRGYWDLGFAAQSLPRYLLQKVPQIQLDPDSVQIDSFMSAKEFFPRLSLIKLGTMHARHIDEPEEVFLNEGVACDIEYALPDFQMGTLVGGIHVQGQIATQATCSECGYDEDSLLCEVSETVSHHSPLSPSHC